jgi:hypothetical protein
VAVLLVTFQVHAAAMAVVNSSAVVGHPTRVAAVVRCDAGLQP